MHAITTVLPTYLVLGGSWTISPGGSSSWYRGWACLVLCAESLGFNSLKRSALLSSQETWSVWEGKSQSRQELQVLVLEQTGSALLGEGVSVH